MSFPRYPAYKPSGVEWLGEVPEHWQVKPLKRVADIQTGLAKGKEVEPEESVEVPFLRVANVQDGFLDLENVHTITITESSLNRYLLRPGDVLMNEGGDFDKLGRGCIWDGTINPCIHQNHVFAVRPHSVRPSWLNVYTSSTQANSYFISRSKQSTNLASISSSNLMDLLVPIASDSETEEILDFLDHETAKIDALIAEQQRLIKLLQEKRQAMISHAVTKGLNPDAPMKDSGVEWLGEVPEHWEVKPLKYLVTLASGGTPSKENLAYWDGSIPWASSKDLKADELFDTQDHISQKAIDDGAATLIPAGSILTVVRGMILRHTFPVAITRVPMAINQDLKVIRPSGQVTSVYLAWLLSGSSGEVLSRVDEAGHGTKVLRIDWWLTMMVPVPPVAEQKLIAESLIKHLQEIVALTDEAHRGVSVLQERRSALISAAVTGQIDVRGMVTEADAA